MAIQTIEVQRFSLTTSRTFEAVVASLKAGVGRLDLAAFASASKSPGTFAELEEVINRDMGKTHLMLFLEFDHVRFCARRRDRTNLRWCGWSSAIP